LQPTQSKLQSSCVSAKEAFQRSKQLRLLYSSLIWLLWVFTP